MERERKIQLGLETAKWGIASLLILCGIEQGLREGGAQVYPAFTQLANLSGWSIAALALTSLVMQTFCERRARLQCDSAKMMLQNSVDDLRIAEERLILIGKASPDAVWDWDMVSDTVWWGATFGILFGYSDFEIQPHLDFWRNRLHPEDRARVLASLKQLLHNSHRLWRENYRFLRKDGTYAQVEHRGYLIRDSSGKPIRMTGTMMDVSERNSCQIELQSLTNQLEERVVERTAELAQANQELDAFTYSISHDLRAPLRHIKGFIQLIEQTQSAQFNEQGRRYMGIVVDATNKMCQLIEALLAFSRLGRSQLNRCSVNLNTIVQEAIATLDQSAKGREILWSIDPLPTVCADPALMRQVFINLIDNALKYTRHRDTAKIEIHAEEKAGEWLLWIRDNGVGFDMKHAQNLFTVFYRMHSEQEFEGTGIGLANVRRILNRHGGRIWADAEEGVGATFYLTLPSSFSKLPPPAPQTTSPQTAHA